MTKEEIQKYFDRRPKAQELYVVGSIVFINPDDATAYADQMGFVMETIQRGSTSSPTDDEIIGTLEAPEPGCESQEPGAKKNIVKVNKKENTK